MSKRKIESSPEDESDYYYKLGQSAGLEAAGARLVGKALDFYKNRQDEKADLLRDIALEFGKLAKSLHPGEPK